VFRFIAFSSPQGSYCSDFQAVSIKQRGDEDKDIHASSLFSHSRKSVFLYSLSGLVLFTPYADRQE